MNEKFVPSGLNALKRADEFIDAITSGFAETFSQQETVETQKIVEINQAESEPKPAKRPKGRPRKPIDPELANKPKRPKGRPRKNQI